METETLSSYEQSQDKHVLDDSMDVNIPRNDEESDSLDLREISEVNPSMEHKKVISDNTDGLEGLVDCDLSENKENDSDRSLTNSEEDCPENKLDSDNDNEDEQSDEGKEVIESEETNKNLNEDDDRNMDPLAKVGNSDEEDPLGGEDKSSSNDGEFEPLNDDEERDSERGSVNQEDPLNNEEKDSLTDEDKDSVNDEGKNSANEEEKDPLNDGENKTEQDLLSDVEKDPLHEENQIDNDSHSDEENHKDDIPLGKENQKGEDPLNEENQDDESLHQEENNKKDPLDDEQLENEGEKEKDLPGDTKVDSPNEVDSNKEIVAHIDETNKDAKQHKNETEKTEDGGNEKDEKVEDSKEEINKNEASEEEKKFDKNRDVIKDCPLLKETLTKIRSEGDQQKEADGENGLEEMDMDDDFDPSLLCPDIAMEVDEAPVITSSDNVQNDGSKSPLLYEAAFSTYVDEMTGAEVSFNLTPEEQQLRQQTYGEANPVQYTKIHCTACNVHLGSALDGQSNRFVHPLLKVLICKDCYHFYTSGEFEKDEDGSELYCRWCGQGGQVMCCSGCEMVFCKKCVRINFGRKKLTEIRDSDDWYCFRCNPTQLISLRVHCAEFMEYVRREISRAATLENATTFMTTDFTQCCLSQKKKYTEPHPSEPKAKKKRKSSVDPDYDPFREQDSPQPSTSGIKPMTTEANTPLSKPVPILPKPMDPNHNAGVVTQVSNPTTLFKVGNTTFRPRTATFSQARPRVQVINPTPSSPAVRPSSGPGYIKIMPGGIRVTPTTSRTQTAQTYVSASSVRPQPSFHQRPPRPLGNVSNQMKHEWFEKTVRAAARVNSNLSYTLTQLNRAQATATSVEALAVVHNKLQEILSTSINSLIQIRKNLRTEFIAGIKNIRFPSNKPPQPQPSTSAQDDDVIFVSPTPSPVPPPLTPTSNHLPPLSSLQLPPSVSLTKSMSSSPSTILDPVPSTSKGVTNEKPKMFLRVKSLTALQNVTSECITIPDDPLPPPRPPPLTPFSQTRDVTIVDDSPEKNGTGLRIKDVTSIIETDPLQNDLEEKLQNNVEEKLQNNVDEKVVSAANVVTNGNEQSQSSKKTMKGISEFEYVSYNLKDHPSPELRKMLNTKVYIKRSEEIDNLVKNTFGLVNGNASE